MKETAINEVPAGAYISGKGPAIVFLHSSLSSARQWSPLVKRLQSHFTCINIDILGYGNAEKVLDKANYNFNVELTRIRRIIEASIGDKPYHIIGHSCGGAIALKLAFEAPKKALSLFLYEPVAFHLLKQGSVERAQADSFAEQIAGLSNEKSAQIFTDFWNSEGFFVKLPTKMQTLMAADMNKVNLDFKGLTTETYQLSDLAIISCPANIYSGLKSPLLSQTLAAEIAKALPNGVLKPLNAGHMGPVNQAELVLSTIADDILNLT